MQMVGGVPFNQHKFKKEFIEKIGISFCNERKDYPTEPIGDSVEIAKVLYKKWRHDMISDRYF